MLYQNTVMIASTSALDRLREELEPYGARLVAVSKTKPVEAIRALYEKGQRDFGENRVQELTAKQEELPENVRWHLIGHLQTNKVKYVVPFVHLIHSVDRTKVLKEINKQAAKIGRRVDVLLQFKIAEEDTKYGLDWDEAEGLLRSEAYANMDYVRICGVMGMATFTEDETQIRKEFKKLKSLFERLKEQFFAQEDAFREISMGMSADYAIALEEGSTLVRIGTLLFGERD